MEIRHTGGAQPAAAPPPPAALGAAQTPAKKVSPIVWLIVGIVGLFVIVFLVTAPLITTIAVPRLNRSKMHALETAAIKRIQTIHTAQTMYQSQFGRFATSLMELARADDLIDRNLASGVQGGYKYVMVGTGSAYTITAVPIAYNSTGSRAFYSDQTMQIRQDHGPEPATAQSPEVGN